MNDGRLDHRSIVSKIGVDILLLLLALFSLSSFFYVVVFLYSDFNPVRTERKGLMDFTFSFWVDSPFMAGCHTLSGSKSL